MHACCIDIYEIHKTVTDKKPFAIRATNFHIVKDLKYIIQLLLQYLFNKITNSNMATARSISI